LIGREAELSRLRDLVADPDLRILTLTAREALARPGWQWNSGVRLRIALPEALVSCNSKR